MNPLVSIVMPVYNTAPYLAESVGSLLAQDHADMEMIFINDGSTDNSAEVLQSFSDPRIRIYSNEGNKGLVYTLNRGLELARGKYIARMDGDDVCLPQRISRQVAYLEANPDVDLLASTVVLIGEKGEPLGQWQDDALHVSESSIRAYLPVNNCIAHPSIMAKAEVIRSYGYSSTQSQAEDYDLWLRMAADGRKMHKLSEALVKHRIVHNSFTRKRQQNVFRKLARTKWTFASSAIRKGQVNGFVLKTLLHAGIDSVKGMAKSLKQTS